MGAKSGHPLKVEGGGGGEKFLGEGWARKVFEPWLSHFVAPLPPLSERYRDAVLSNCLGHTMIEYNRDILWFVMTTLKNIF